MRISVLKTMADRHTARSVCRLGSTREAVPDSWGGWGSPVGGLGPVKEDKESSWEPADRGSSGCGGTGAGEFPVLPEALSPRYPHGALGAVWPGAPGYRVVREERTLRPCAIRNAAAGRRDAS